MPLSTNISVILWQSDLLVEEIGVHRENDWSATSHWHCIMLYRVHLTMSGWQTEKQIAIKYFKPVFSKLFCLN